MKFGCRLWGYPRLWWALDSNPYHRRGSHCVAKGNVPSLHSRRHELLKGTLINIRICNYFCIYSNYVNQGNSGPVVLNILPITLQAVLLYQETPSRIQFDRSNTGTDIMEVRSKNDFPNTEDSWSIFRQLLNLFWHHDDRWWQCWLAAVIV